MNVSATADDPRPPIWFREQVAVDPESWAPVAYATFTVYGMDDVERSAPLQVLDVYGEPITLQSGSYGVTPKFRAPGHTEVLIVSSQGLATRLEAFPD